MQQPALMMIYKIFTNSEWQSLRASGETAGAPVDLQDGYIHFSTAGQVAETAAKHFAGQTELWLIGVDADRLGDALRWEVSRGGADFPHLYAKLSLDQVSWAQPLPFDGAQHQFPPGLT